MNDYDRHPPLDEAQLLPDPLAQLERWLSDAAQAGQIEPTAMALATVAADGQPSVRMVLYKGAHDGGLTFYTNYESRKGIELSAQPRAALVFWWDRLERQVRAEGAVERLPRTQSEAYFRTRPRLSQLAAFTSRQSRAVDSRAALDERLARHERELQGREVPLPASWGGYVLRPQAWEFWQGRRGRLHDRIAYRRDEGGAWRLQRLEP